MLSLTQIVAVVCCMLLGDVLYRVTLIPEVYFLSGALTLLAYEYYDEEDVKK
jgi:hypothetical protein